MSEISIPGVDPADPDPSFSADDVVVDADGITATNVNDALEELAAAVAALEAGQPDPLTYPMLVWEWTGSETVAANGGGFSIPTAGFIVANPAGWTTSLANVALPDGVYAITWYWEHGEGAGTFFDNYLNISDIPGSYGVTYPTAPMANPNSYWGFCSATIKLVATSGGNNVQPTVYNPDASPRDFTFSLMTITRLDA
jgi:hypothetical protein